MTGLFQQGVRAFTVAPFVAGEAFADPVVRGAAKMGAMLSFSAALMAVLLARALGIRKIL